MAKYTVELDASQVKAIEYIALSVQGWIDNAVHSRARVAKEEIYEAEVKRMTDDPDITSIPADKDQVVLDADIKSVAQRNKEIEDSVPE